MDGWRELLRRPLIVAPMAGGPSNPGLAAACAEAGALPFLAGGYRSAAGLTDEVRALRSATNEAFGVNLFVPGTAVPAGSLTGYLEELAFEAEAVGAVPGAPSWDDDGWEAKLAALLADPPPAVSFTFGCPPAEVAAAFRSAGSVVAVTVTTVDEARAATAAGADLLCVQGIEAGAHRGSFENAGRASPSGPPLAELVRQVVEATDVPVAAAGGIVTAGDVQAVLAAGAVAAQCGTAFLRCPESGAHPRHKAALADPSSTGTVFTRAFSGRWARGIENDFMRRHPDAPAAYPEVNNATRPIRAAAAAGGDAGRMSLWAGTGFRAATDRPAGEVVDVLCGPVA